MLGLPPNSNSGSKSSSSKNLLNKTTQSKINSNLLAQANAQIKQLQVAPEPPRLASSRNSNSTKNLYKTNDSKGGSSVGAVNRTALNEYK